MMRKTEYRKEYTMQIYKVIRPEDVVYISILRNKNDGTYSFINLTKGHICPCRFLSEEEALLDLEEQKQKGKVISYEMCNIITGREGEFACHLTKPSGTEKKSGSHTQVPKP